MPAPFGFYVQGDWGNAMGTQNVNFRYGTEQLEKSIETGYADAPMFDYKTSDTFIEADIKEGSTILETLHLDLIKVPVTAWAGTAGDFTAKRGVIYEATSHWPLSMAATRSLSDASVLDGLWGLVGSATSTFEIKAHSGGSAMSGDLDTKVQFRLGLKQKELTLTGQHMTTLNESGLSTVGTFNSSDVGTSISASAGLSSLVPGASAALSAIGISGAGIGAKVTGSLSGSISGGYAAETSDSEIKFTSGSLTATADIYAQINATPKFLHGILKLQIGGGGGATITIQVAPTPSVTSLTGYLHFTLVAKVFGFGPDIDKEWPVGDPPPAPLTFFGMTVFASQAPLALSGGAPANAFIPAQGQAMVRNFEDRSLITYAAPHTTDPNPASEIIIAQKSEFSESWSTQRVSDPAGHANVAPSLSHVPNSTGSHGVVVWSQSTGTNPADFSGVAAFMDSTELRFAYYFGPTGQAEATRVLTTNGSADFGPSVVRSTGADLARLFWVRGSGSDFYGSTTALTILTLDWTGGYNPSATVGDPSTIWSPEVTAVSGLTHIMDWRAAAWDANNAAIAIIRDMDGDLDTVDDTELWIARQTAGAWAAPVRVTTNAVADQAPSLLFKNATTFVIGWRQGDTVVGTTDFDNAPPAVWFDAASEVAENWDDAQIHHRVTPDSLALFWRQDDGIAYTDEQFGDIAPGTAWPARRFVPLGGGAMSAFDATFSTLLFSNYEEARVTAVVENATGATPTTAPTTLNASATTVVLYFGDSGSALSFLEDIESADIAVGDPLKLCARAQGPGPFTYQWYRDGVAIQGATSYALDLGTATADESGEYQLRVRNGTQLIKSSVASIRIGTDLYPDWIAAHGYAGPDADPDADPDKDGAKNRLEYLFNTSPRDSAERPTTEYTRGGYDFDAILFDINRRATGVNYVVEQSSDLVTWNDVTSLTSTVSIAADHARHRIFFPRSADSVVSFPYPITDRSFFRVRLTSGP